LPNVVSFSRSHKGETKVKRSIDTKVEPWIVPDVGQLPYNWYLFNESHKIGKKLITVEQTSVIKN
jgi:hypothetical protein